MFAWLSQNSDALNVLTGFGTLIIWLVYAQLLYLGFRRQRRPRLIINRGKKKDIDALCIISNMSAEPVFVEYIMAKLKTSAGTITMDVTDFDREYNEGDESESEEDIDRRNLMDTPVRENTRQGPLDSGNFLHIGTFNELIKRLAKGADIEMQGARPKNDKIQFHSLSIRLICVYGPEDMPIGAERSFDLVDNEHSCTLLPSTWNTKRLSSMRQRHKLKKQVADLNERNFMSSSTIRVEQNEDDGEEQARN